MFLFTSKRERRLWSWALAVVVAIYSTLGLAGKLSAALRDQNLLGISFVVGFLLIVLAIIGSGLKKGSGHRELWAVLGISAVYWMVMIRLFVSLEERTHLVEYGILATLIYEALRERASNGGKVPNPAILAIVIAALLGWLDEGIQAILPNRVYDIIDIGFNALAGLMAVLANFVLQHARRWRN